MLTTMIKFEKHELIEALNNMPKIMMKFKDEIVIDIIIAVAA